jgi:transposase InsO family protein
MGRVMARLRERGLLVEPENVRQAKLALVTEEPNRQLEAGEYTYNCVRPHETLDYLTPNEYYRQWKQIQKSQV